MATLRVETKRRYQHLIAGQWVDSASGQTITRTNPATGEPVAQFAAGTEADVARAVAAARDAFDQGPWPRLSGTERSRVLLRLADRVREQHNRLVAIEVEEVGKPIRQARGDIDGAIGLIEYAASLAPHVHGDAYTNLGQQYVATVSREPAGVVGQIIPWNFPALLYCQKMPFALAAGCTVVVKPSEFTSSSAIEISRLAHEVGVPADALNVVTGLGGVVGQAIVENPEVDRISFTGSTATGRKIVAGSVGNLKRVSLELGGKGANIVFDDADLDAALDGALVGIYMNQGECCSAGSRLLLGAKIADEFLDRLISRVRALRTGDPMAETTDLGALINETQLHKVLDYIDLGKKAGARILVGGERLGGGDLDRGYFVEPTIFDQVRPDMRIFQDEIFGPVLSVSQFNTVDEAIRIANDTTYGLANAVWTNDLDRAVVVSRALRSGTVCVNTIIDGAPQLPFGGYKSSGFGREMGTLGLDEFTEVKTTLVHLGKRTPFFGVSE